jgi:threonine dehydrogenase-like Zn-dependent dehydrogenase
MKALTWHGRRDVRVDDVPDPTIQKPTDAIVRITTTAICGSDLHLYEVLGPFIEEGSILGHEPMGVVEEVGAEVTELARRPRRDPVPDRLRQLLHVRPGPPDAV